MKAAAAALVAQLTASGDPKAILEAMAALPQVMVAIGTATWQCPDRLMATAE